MDRAGGAQPPLFPFPLGKFPLGAPADWGGGESASSPGVQGCSPSSCRKEALKGSGTGFIEASFGLLTLPGLKRWLRAGGSAPAPFLALNPSPSPQRVPLAPCWPSGSRQARNRAGRGETALLLLLGCLGCLGCRTSPGWQQLLHRPESCRQEKMARVQPPPRETSA